MQATSIRFGAFSFYLLLEYIKQYANVRQYYQQFEEQQTQSLIDQRIKEHLGQAAAFQQVGAAYNQHLLAQRPRLPVLPTPMMPMPGGIRPPVLPRPPMMAPQGYVHAPGMPPMMAPPGAPPFQGQLNGLPRPPQLAPPTTVPGTTATPSPSGPPPPMAPLPIYQPNPTPQTSGGFDSFNSNEQSP
ncbi:U1 small nuclear ribonucleoprotein C-like [Rutidosis leptorrhynchoides]|uniref:U1 small nuclear ribonucleoprotein C-like n=1 Tax=Rutidosis leptorrhynchoides TaxID=125765 RepID=UPI003A996F28